MWAIVMLHNVDTLEVYEEAICQSEQDLEHLDTPHEPANHERVLMHSTLPTPLTAQAQALMVQVGAPEPNSRNQPKP